MQFPRLIFRSPGTEQCQGGSYSYKLVRDEEEFSAGLADGFYSSLPEALSPPPVIAPVVIQQMATDADEVPAPETEDTAPPTSYELRRKAKELGLMFKRSASDEEIGRLIAIKLGA